jgi:hypothetical protein
LLLITIQREQLHRDCFTHLIFDKEGLSSLLPNSPPATPHTHYQISSDSNVYDGIDLAIKVILKKNTFDTPTELASHWYHRTMSPLKFFQPKNI